MKDYKEMSQRVLARRDQYHARKAAARRVWAKRGLGLAAACLCLLFAVQLVRSQAGNISTGTTEPGKPDTFLYAPESDVRNELAPETQPGSSGPETGNPGELEPDIAPVTEPCPDGSHNGAFLPDNGNGQSGVSEITPLISGYGDMVPGANTDKAISDGAVSLSPSLMAAMEAYGEIANYRVLVELFRQGTQIPSGGASALQERQRLADLGYIVALEIVTTTETRGEYVSAETVYYFTLHATWEQLQNFQPDPQLGYFIMLYDEYFGDSLAMDTSIVYSGFASPRS